MFDWTQNWIVCPTVDDRLMFLFIFLHFECHRYAVCEFQVGRWCKKQTPILKESNIPKAKLLCAFHFPSRDLQVFAGTTGKETRANS